MSKWFLKRKELQASYLRNLVFGVEDGLVSTVGFLSGVAFAGVEVSTLILSGMVLIAVEAFSMAVGSLLSEHSVEEYLTRKEVAFGQLFSGSLVMFFAYIGAGAIPLLPYLLIEGSLALFTSVLLSLCALFLLGIYNAKQSHLNLFWHGVEMFVIGGLAILIGLLVGQVMTW